MRLHLVTAEDPLTLDARAREWIRFPQLTMPLLAALTPEPWVVTHTDEITHGVDTTQSYDLVGLTAATPGDRVECVVAWWMDHFAFHILQDARPDRLGLADDYDVHVLSDFPRHERRVRPAHCHRDAPRAKRLCQRISVWRTLRCHWRISVLRVLLQALKNM